MDKKPTKNLETVQHHFAYEAANDIEKVITTYTDDVIWEAPARDFIISGKTEVAKHYQALFASITDVSAEILRQFAVENYVFDDRIMTFAACKKDNIWSAKIGDRIQQRLVHLFEIRESKICREIAYEMWKIL